MTQSHIGSLLPIKNRVLSVDEQTAFLAHYDLNEQDVLRGVKAMGQKEVPFWQQTKFIAKGAQYEIYTNLTLSAWVFPTVIPSSDRGCLMIGKGVGGYYLTIDNTMKLGAYWHGKTPAGYHASTAACPLNQWTHLAAVWSSTQLKLYINGELDRTIAVTGTGNRVDTVELGTEQSGSRPYEGKARGFGIWAAEKSQDDIRKIMRNGLAGSENGVRAFWKMDEGQGDLLADSSPFQQDLVIEPGKTVAWQTGDSFFTLHPEEGKFGGAVAVEEATRNLAPGNLASFRSDVKYTYVGEEKGYSKYAIEGTWTGGTYPYSFSLGSPAYKGGVSYSASCRMWTNVPEKFISNFGDLAIVNDSAMTGKRQLVRDGAYSARLDYIHSQDWAANPTYVFSRPIADGTVFDPKTDFLYIKEIQVEEKAFATSFTNGWRSQGNLVYNLNDMGIDPLGDWTISGWFKRRPGIANWSGIFGIGNYYQVGESEFQIWTNHGGQMKAYSHDSQVGRSRTLIAAPNTGEFEEWFYVAVTRERSTNAYNCYVWTKDRFVKENWNWTHVNPIPRQLYIGGTQSGGHVFNGWIDELRIDKVVRTEEELTAWYESNSPFWPRGIYRKSY